MLTVFLAISLAYDPVPKNAPTDGKIALVLRQPDAEMILFSPSKGTVEKRIDIGDMKEKPVSLRLFRDGNSAVIISSVVPPGLQENKYQCWLIDLTETKKPKRLFERDSWFRAIPEDDGRSLIVCGPESAKNAKNNQNGGLTRYSTFSYDIASGKSKPIEVPNDSEVFDLSSVGQSLLVDYMVDDNYRPAFYNRKSGKLTLAPANASSAGCASKNARKILAHIREPDTNVINGSRLAVFDLVTKTRQELELPWGCSSPNCYAISPDGSRLCFVITLANNGGTKLFISDPDGKNAKAIYEAKQEETLVDCDWR